MSFKLNALYIVSIYYIIWIGLPIFFKNNDDNDYLIKKVLFPLNSDIAIHLPILVMLIGLMVIGTFIGILCIQQHKIIDQKNKNREKNVKNI